MDAAVRRCAWRPVLVACGSVYSGGLLVAVGPMVRLATDEMVHTCAQFTVHCPDLGNVICVTFELLKLSRTVAIFVTPDMLISDKI
jgi:hypothetical protein